MAGPNVYVGINVSTYQPQAVIGVGSVLGSQDGLRHATPSTGATPELGSSFPKALQQLWVFEFPFGFPRASPSHANPGIPRPRFIFLSPITFCVLTIVQHLGFLNRLYLSPTPAYRGWVHNLHNTQTYRFTFHRANSSRLSTKSAALSARDSISEVGLCLYGRLFRYLLQCHAFHWVHKCRRILAVFRRGKHLRVWWVGVLDVIDGWDLACARIGAYRVQS